MFVASLNVGTRTRSVFMDADVKNADYLQKMKKHG